MLAVDLFPVPGIAMRPLMCLSLMLLSLSLSACGDKEKDNLVQEGDPAVREKIKAWMTGFDADLDAGQKAYDNKSWLLPGDPGDSNTRGRQILNQAPCDMLAMASTRPVAAESAGGQISQVRALWLYAVAGCAGPDTQAQAQALGVLESARRRLLVQWERELEALPGSVRIEVKAGERAKKVTSAVSLGVNEHIACMTKVSGAARANSQKLTLQQATRMCGNNSDITARYGACPVAWAASHAHSMADNAKIPRDDNAWMGDATARYRMAWRACDDNALAQWQAYVPQMPATLREGRLKRIAAAQDPLMNCQFRQFRKLVNKYGPTLRANKDNDVMAWCGRQFGLQYLSNYLEPPRTFTPEILNDSGRSVSWLYDPAKADLRPNEWKFTGCMRSVAQRMAQEGLNLPEPEVLDQYCKVKGGKVAADYLSGVARAQGLAKPGDEPN